MKKDLSLLEDSAKRTNYPERYDPSILQRFKNPNLSHKGNLTIELYCPEFTSLCEITKQPDFGRIKIIYQPYEWCVESKSLKLYLFGFRNHMAFHERSVDMIGEDLTKLLKPKWLEVTGIFLPRGGISITANYQYHNYGEQI